ncbi:hypothetical protein ABLE93_12260 [Xanthobacter sp. KR7-65]|uniref:hypothetical protein n=1 Tax=Xanthobacter sp. KR7-65 TaxID=3156612 RepID=UPI0032B61C5C
MKRSRMEKRACHAFPAEDAETQMARLMPGLAVFCAEAHGLARALRQARKAARVGAAGYDPARHAALLRLKRYGAHKGATSQERPQVGVERKARAAVETGTRAKGQSPSNSAVER